MNRIDRFMKFEMENKLLSKKIQDIEYWSIVREIIFNDVNSSFEDINLAHENFNNSKLLDRLTDISVFIKNAIKYKMQPLVSKEILVINHPRRQKNGMYYDCLYTDSILEDINYSYYVFEESYFKEHLQPVRNKEELRYTDRINLIFYLEYFLSKIFRVNKLTNYDKKQIIDIIEKLNNEFKINLDKNIYIDKIQTELIKFKLLRKYYSKVIRKINPKLIIEVISYERRRKVINSIAKEYGIPTIELQHGTIGKYEIAYNYCMKYNIHTFPDYIFLFGDYWKDNSRFPINSNKIFSVGWPYFEEKSKEYKDYKAEEKKKIILFISQGTIGVKLSKLAVELNSMINKNCYKIKYKLHPGEYNRWRIDYPWLVDTDIEVINHSNKDMHYYFSEASIQVGVYSTSIFEGLGYGLITMIYKIYGYQFMEELYMNKYATLVNSAVDILNNVENKSVDIKKVDKAYFWKEDSIKNIHSVINYILKMRDI